jgi:hypothetical protein
LFRAAGILFSILACAGCASSDSSGAGPPGSGSGGSVTAGTGGSSSGSGGEAAGSGGDNGGASGGAGGGAGVPTGDSGMGGVGGTPMGMGGYGFAGPSLCANAGFALCESFENGLDATAWTTSRGGDGTATVDEVHAARGTKALHVKTASGGGHVTVTEKKTFPIAGNNLYARMFVWFEDDITTSGHFSIAEGAGTGNSARIRFGGQFKEFGVGTDGGGSGDWTDHDSVVVPSKKWLCVEFQFQGDANQFHVWQDDVARPALTSGATKHGGFVMPQFTSLWFGWWMYNANEPQDLWIDEIAIDSKPIGCAR